jgi:hypothetical protein
VFNKYRKEIQGHCAFEMIFDQTYLVSFIIGVIVLVLVYGSVAMKVSTKSKGKRERSSTMEFTDAIERAHDILPAIKNFLRESLMYRFLNSWYQSEIDGMMKTNCQLQAWSSVAHSSVPKESTTLNSSDGNKVPTYATMNIAFPDLSAEYYTSFLPASHAPVFYLSQCPDWAVYAALTLYDAYGLPVASVNLSQLQAFIRVVESGVDVEGEVESCAGRLVAVTSHVMSTSDSTSNKSLKVTGVFVNLMKGCAYKGRLCAVFRIYRPADIDITPREAMPWLYLVDRAECVEGTRDLVAAAASSALTLLATSPLSQAFEAGLRIENFFSRMIKGKLREPTANLIGCQFFHPIAVVGCFPNADAVYVVAWKPQHGIGMIIRGKVPPKEAFRPYYGIMGIDHRSTRTLASVTFEQLGGWGSSYAVYLARTEKEAVSGGYDACNPLHSLLLWEEDTVGPLGVVIRYLHYFHDIGRQGGLTVGEVERARTERNALIALDGNPSKPVPNIPGLGKVEYF